MSTVASSKLWPIDVVSVSSLTSDHISELLERAEHFQDLLTRRMAIEQTLAGRVIAMLFLEPSTRTMLSFQTAAVRLGANWINSDNSSLTKGESLEDTLSVVSRYADLIVMRQPGENTAELATYSMCNLINAGDGSNEHPTQALIDLFSIRHFNGRLDNLTIGVGFDPLHSRSIRSLLRALALFKNNRVVLVAPIGFQLGGAEIEELQTRGLTISTSTDKADLLQCETIYLNRLQRERLPSELSEATLGEDYRILAEDIADDECPVRFILDPLPKVDEIDPKIDHYTKAKYFEQAKFGVPVRMALMELLLTHRD